MCVWNIRKKSLEHVSIVSEGESLFGDLGLKLIILGIKSVEILYIIPPSVRPPGDTSTYIVHT